jgi:hypothetical protein
MKIENPSKFKTKTFMNRVKSKLGIKINPKAAIAERSISSGTIKYRKPTIKNIFTPHYFDKRLTPTEIEGQLENSYGNKFTLEHLDLAPDVRLTAQEILNKKLLNQKSMNRQRSEI